MRMAGSRAKKITLIEDLLDVVDVIHAQKIPDLIKH